MLTPLQRRYLIEHAVHTALALSSAGGSAAPSEPAVFSSSSFFNITSSSFAARPLPLSAAARVFSESSPFAVRKRKASMLVTDLYVELR